MRQFLAALILLAVTCFAAPLVVAQVASQSTSFISPFPKGSTYRMVVVGDWFADSLLPAVRNAIADEAQISTSGNVIQVRTLRRLGWDRLINGIERRVRANPFDIAVVMLGAAEIGSLRIPGRRRIRFGSDQWKAQYANRIDRLMKALRKGGAAIYWLGMPTLRGDERNDGAQFLNEIFRERAYINGVKYISTYNGFADETGNYNRYGADLTGKIRLLRTRDGMYFTSAGYRKVAHYAERAIRRDLRRAKAERNVPLAGNEVEQRRVNPRRAAALLAATGRQGESEPSKKHTPIGSSTTSAPSPVAAGFGLRGQKADDSTIALRVVENGVEKTERIRILRPAISATVVALLTRKQSRDKATRLGDNLAVELPGGVVVLNSITPVTRGPLDGNRNRFSPTQSPFFKVWAKGERLRPKTGRADDIQWPRPEPKLAVRTKYVPGEDPRSSSGNDRPAVYRPPAKRTPAGFPPLPSINPQRSG
ncbi:MAG: SGNH/GDSL hydrolase family protein [Hyphomicrobiaceae bacterium]